MGWEAYRFRLLDSRFRGSDGVGAGMTVWVRDVFPWQARPAWSAPFTSALSL